MTAIAFVGRHRFNAAPLGVRRAHGRCGATFERRAGRKGARLLHRTVAGTRSGAPARTMICERSGPTETYETGMAALCSTKET